MRLCHTLRSFLCWLSLYVLRSTADQEVGAVTTLAGGLSTGYSDGTATAAMFNEPYGVVLNPSGDFALVVSTNAAYA